MLRPLKYQELKDKSNVLQQDMERVEANYNTSIVDPHYNSVPYSYNHWSSITKSKKTQPANTEFRRGPFIGV